MVEDVRVSRYKISDRLVFLDNDADAFSVETILINSTDAKYIQIRELFETIHRGINNIEGIEDLNG